MKLLLKGKMYFDNETKTHKTPAPQWVEVDTSFLSTNQYNCIGIDRRVFDSDVLAVRDDARRNKGRCRYCGAIVERGQEEKHFTEREKAGCAGCFWQRDRQTGETVKTKHTATENGETVEIITETRKYKKACTYCESSGAKTACTLTECRAYGIEWFTPENTYFLKYPDGFAVNGKDIARITRDFVPVWANSSTLRYPKQFTSYVLLADFGVTGQNFQHFTIRNARNSINFLVNLDECGNLEISIIDSMGMTTHRNFSKWGKVISCNDILKKFFLDCFRDSRKDQ